MIDQATIQLIVYVIILIWGMGTTVYSIWLSRRNNEFYNKRIIKLLSEIKHELEVKNEQAR